MTRRFAFVPLWAISVYLIYAMRRVDCPRHDPATFTIVDQPRFHVTTTQIYDKRRLAVSESASHDVPI